MPPEGPSKPYRRHERGLSAAGQEARLQHRERQDRGLQRAFKSWGLDPLPFYTEPPQSATSTPELFKKYPLVMITGARSQLYLPRRAPHDPVAAREMPDPMVEIHPDTAKTFGIDDGEWVYLENDMGRVKRKATITRKVKPHHVHTMHGWWLPENGRHGAEPVRRLGLPDQQDHPRPAMQQVRLRRRPVQDHAVHTAQDRRLKERTMARYAILIDYDYCTGCHTCEVACQQEHDYPAGTRGG